jgi:Protein of unknown function (DUF3626)
LADPTQGEPKRNLDHYIEAQVHSAVNLKHDVEKLVADPSFNGTVTDDVLQRISEKFNFPMIWHAGFALPL